VILFVVPGAAETFELTRDAIGDGELWRIATGHLSHASVDHLVWCVVVFLALGWILERRSPGRFAFGLLLSTVAVSFGVLLLAPGLPCYRGLSGIDSALFAMLAADYLRRALAERHWRGAAVVALFGLAFFGKTAVEAITGGALFVDVDRANLTPVPIAHVIGVLCGCLAALLPPPGRIWRHENRMRVPGGAGPRPRRV
jgi:rhomboid family GlyGly-CTERM serine protease